MAKNQLAATFLDVVAFADGTNATDGAFMNPRGEIEQAYGFIVKIEGDYEVMDTRGIWSAIPLSENTIAFNCSGVRNVGDTTVSTITAGKLFACWG